MFSTGWGAIIRTKLDEKKKRHKKRMKTRILILFKLSHSLFSFLNVSALCGKHSLHPGPEHTAGLDEGLLAKQGELLHDGLHDGVDAGVKSGVCLGLQDATDEIAQGIKIRAIGHQETSDVGGSG